MEHTESMLFIHNDQSQLRERDALLNDRMGPDHDLRGPGGHLFAHGFTRGGTAPATHEHHGQPERFQKPLHRPIMLLGENFRRGHQGGLIARPAGQHHRLHRHDGFTGPDIPLHQAVHLFARRHVRQDLAIHPLLSCGQLKGQGPIQLPEKRRLRIERDLLDLFLHDSLPRGQRKLEQEQFFER